ncbi:MAG: hypothetical protein ACP5PJ_04910 [Acidimicrobiales bacterium]
MKLLLFPLFMSAVACTTVIWLLFRHGAFMERFRNERAVSRAVEVARNAEKSFSGYARITLIAVVRDNSTLLLGYKPAELGALTSLPKVERPGNGETMVVWMPPDTSTSFVTLEQWCNSRAELYMKIDTISKVVRLSDVDLDDSIELTLVPSR